MYGLISAMVGVGLMVGTQLVTKLVRNRSKAHVVLCGLFVLGIAAFFLGAFRNTPMAALSTFTMGFAIAFIIVPAQTMSQQETPPAMVGRVSSTIWRTSSATNCCYRASTSTRRATSNNSPI